MKDLMTRKIILGILMTLVLGFGVPGVVEAVITDLGTESASTVDPTARQVESDMPTRSITPTLEDTADDPGVGDHTADPLPPGTDTTNSSESITVSTTNIQLRSPTFTTGTVTFYELPADRTETATSRRLTSEAITLDGHFIRPGIATLTISYTDLSDSQSNSTQGSTTSKTITHKYTYYVVKADTDIPETTTFSLAGASSRGYQTGLNGRTDFSLYSNSSGNYPVTFSVLNGAGSAITNGLYQGTEAYSPDETQTGYPISSSSRRKVWLNMNGADTFGPGATSVVRVRIGSLLNSAAPRSDFNVVYIIGSPKLGIGLASTTTGVTTVANDETKKYIFSGGTAGADAGTITATVMDGASTPVGIEGALVKFELRHKGSTTGYLRSTPDTSLSTAQVQVDSKNNSVAGAMLLSDVQTLYVRTGTGGVATANYEFGTLESQEITVSSVGLSAKVTAEFGRSAVFKEISGESVKQQSGNPKKYDLVAVVKEGKEPIEDMVVTFTTNNGTLTRVSPAPNTSEHGVTGIDTGRFVNVVTNSQGKAVVVYDIDDNTGRQEIHASIYDNNLANDLTTTLTVNPNIINPNSTPEVNETTFRQYHTFVVNGSARRDPPASGTQPARLDISVFGEDGDTSRAVIVSALNSAGQAVSSSIPITLSGTALVTSQPVNTGAVTTITPPTAADTYTLIATDPAGTYASDTETITVGGPSGEGTLNVTTVGTPVNRQQTIEVTAQNADGTAPSGSVVVTLSGAVSRTVDTLNGTGRAIITLPNTATYTLTLSADGYATRSVTLSTTGAGTQPGGSTPPPAQGSAGEADSVRIASDPFPSGPANTRLAQPLRVQVLDANGNGVANVRVTFEVVSGQGRLSQRGNGRAVRANTDRNGNASANYTPLADGTSRVRATAADVTQTVTFTITAGAAAPSPDDTTPSETDVTPSREINPVVQVNASQRPPMLWVDGGSIYALVGADVQEFASGVDNALNIAVAGGKIYWTEQTGDSAGTINSANLNGSNVKELKSIMAVPMGIAVDTAGDKLYWTNSRGRIQSLNADGSGRVENVMLDLPGPRDIAVARGNLYWTQYDATEGEGNVGIVNPNSAQKVARYTSTGSDAPGSLTVAGGKIYWTEMTGTSSGTINSANLNGTNAMELASIRAVPIGIGVDAARSKLYWTNSRGRVQSANLDGSKIQNVVDGLGSPGDMVLSNSIAAPAATATPTTASNKYDVNGDGSVDSKDVDALIVAVAAGVTDAKYDVNGDGKVDIFDVSAVSSKRDDGAASAPTLLGTKLSIVQIDRLQEQIDLLVASNDRSPDALRILTYLHQLIVMARPEKTQLLANYPNPFNPETWIPYELATDTTVKITIYNTHGVVIRTLALGHQSAGYYTGRDRAAYWDGRNALGEQVASGIYFYQFETDEMSSMRKMVILK